MAKQQKIVSKLTIPGGEASRIGDSYMIKNRQKIGYNNQKKRAKPSKSTHVTNDGDTVVIPPIDLFRKCGISSAKTKLSSSLSPSPPPKSPPSPPPAQPSCPLPCFSPEEPSAGAGVITLPHCATLAPIVTFLLCVCVCVGPGEGEAREKQEGFDG